VKRFTAGGGDVADTPWRTSGRISMPSHSTKQTVLCLCAWCRAVITVVEFSWTAGAGDTTHGLCRPCLKRLEERSVAPQRRIANLRT
jgi:hypothetical protein